MIQEIIAIIKEPLESQVTVPRSQDTVGSQQSVAQKRALAEPARAGTLSLDFEPPEP